MIRLRKALNQTQTDFAVRTLDMAVSTVARLETSTPPTGEMLLRLATIAAKHSIGGLSGEFRLLYVKEVIENLGGDYARFPPATGSERARGYLVMTLEGDQQVEFGRRFMSLLG
jgi:transcriptional regulator with XRE-family HTH domain